MLCREYVAQLRDHEEEIEAAGASIAAVGTGGTRYAEAFAQEHNIAFPLLLDRDLTSYRIAGARAGNILGLMGLPTIRSGLRALRAGHRQGESGPHPLMLGATHVLTPDRRVPFAWVNDDYCDWAPVSDVLVALQ